MWDSKAVSLPLKSSPALGANNLSTNGRTFAFTSGSEVHLVSESLMDKGGRSSAQYSRLPSKDSATIMQVKWARFGSKDLLVLATAGGFQIYESDGQRLSFFHSLGDKALGGYCRGIAGATGSGTDFVLVGASTGEVFVAALGGKGIQLHKTLQAHGCAVTDIATSTSEAKVFASGDHSGTVCVWTAGTFAKSAEFPCKTGHPATSLAIHGGHVIAGYGSGHIRLFGLQSKAIAAEICAHSAWIHAIHVSPALNMFASVGEDTTLNVWSAPSAGSKDIGLKFSANVEDRMLTGIQFAGPQKRHLAVTLFDSESMAVFFAA